MAVYSYIHVHGGGANYLKERAKISLKIILAFQQKSSAIPVNKNSGIPSICFILKNNQTPINFSLHSKASV